MEREPFQAGTGNGTVNQRGESRSCVIRQEDSDASATYTAPRRQPDGLGGGEISTMPG